MSDKGNDDRRGGLLRNLVTRRRSGERAGARVERATERPAPATRDEARAARERAARRFAAALASVAVVSCSAGPDEPLTAAPAAASDDASLPLPVPMQLRAIDQGTLRLSGTIAGDGFTLDAPDGDGRWLVRTTVPRGVPIPATLTWSTSDGLTLAVLETELPPVERDGPLRVSAAGYATAAFDEDEDGVANVDELRCDTDPYDDDSVPSSVADCEDAPPPGSTALARLRADGRFDLFVAAVDASGRAELLFSGPNTVMAPTDAAVLASLTSDQYARLTTDPDALLLLVDRHVIPGVAFDGQRLNGLVGNTGFIAADGATIEIVTTAAGELEYSVRSSDRGDSVAATARIVAFDVIDEGGTIVHEVGSLVSIDHSLAISYALLPGDFASGCFQGLNETELPAEAGPFTYTFNPEGTSIIWQDVTLTERARITVTHVDGTPADSGAALYAADRAVVAADDDSGDGLLFLLRSTVLEPGSYCLAYGHYEGEAVPVPAEGWEGSLLVETFPTAGTS